MTNQPSNTFNFRYDSLDLWRGVAALSVLAFHAFHRMLVHFSISSVLNLGFSHRTGRSQVFFSTNQSVFAAKRFDDETTHDAFGTKRFDSRATHDAFDTKHFDGETTRFDFDTKRFDGGTDHDGFAIKRFNKMTTHVDFGAKHFDDEATHVVFKTKQSAFGTKHDALLVKNRHLTGDERCSVRPVVEKTGTQII